MEKISIEREASGDWPWCVFPRLRQPRHPQSRAEHNACGSSRRSHELAPRQQGAFPKMGVANMMVAMWRFPKCRGIYVSDSQNTLLSRTLVSDRLQTEHDISMLGGGNTCILHSSGNHQNQVFIEGGGSAYASIF